MPIQLIRNDITKIECDAIVNAANSTLLGGGGVDGAIHKAAGRGLLLECMKLGGCKTGQAKMTGAYNLPCRYVIHTVGPKWRGGQNGEKELLESCYRESLKLAVERGCESVAFPLISSGVYGYPKAQALRVAMDVIAAFLAEHDLLVYVVIFDKAAYQISEKLFSDIQSYIDDNYVEAHTDSHYEQMRGMQCSQILHDSDNVLLESSEMLPGKAKNTWLGQDGNEWRDEQCGVWQSGRPVFTSASVAKSAFSLEDVIGQIDESFSQMLLRKIDEKGMTDVECYKKANVDRKLFSKIRGDIHYHPSKTTVLAFAIALELNLEETRDMLMKAGFALSRSSKFDIIVEYFIQNGNYNVFEINEALFAFDQNLLGM